MKSSKNIFTKISNGIDSFLLWMSKPSTQRLVMFIAILLCTTINVMAQTDSAFSTATTTIKNYKDGVSSLMKAIGAIIAIIGAFNVFFKMQNGDQDVKKTIMLTIGGCIAFVALGTALPAFFEDN